MTEPWTHLCFRQKEEEPTSQLTCRTTPTALLWPSDRAGAGGAGSSASEDKLSRTVPVTRVLHTVRRRGSDS